MEFVEWVKPSDCNSFWTWVFYFKRYKFTDGSYGTIIRVLGFRFINHA